MVFNMSKEEITKIVQEPTFKYEIKRVVGGRSPKTEITMRFGGDVVRINEELLNKRYEEVMSRIRDLFVKELNELDSQLRAEDG
jgi:hypothetical protein